MNTSILLQFVAKVCSEKVQIIAYTCKFRYKEVKMI